MALKFRNVWGSQGSNLDQQRADLFRVSINLPAVLGGNSVWNNNVQFAVSKFAFPDRTRSTIPIKYLNQTNHTLGADNPSEAVSMTVRYAFNQETATILEKWFWMGSHPGTGAVGLTSYVKANGYAYWLIPNLSQTEPLPIDAAPPANSMLDGGRYVLEGILLVGCKPTDGDMEAAGLVNLELKLQIDRYYPVSPSDLRVAPFGSTVDPSAGIVGM